MNSPNNPDPAAAFIESVLALQPEIAVFDCDGTLWSGDSGRDFFYWEIERGLVSPEVADAMRARYRLYAHEATVRTNHLDETHAYWNGAAYQTKAKGFYKKACDTGDASACTSYGALAKRGY